MVKDWLAYKGYEIIYVTMLCPWRCFFLLNVQQIGFEKCVSILADLVVRAKQAASLDPAQPLQSLVLITILFTNISIHILSTYVHTNMRNWLPNAPP